MILMPRNPRPKMVDSMHVLFNTYKTLNPSTATNPVDLVPALFHGMGQVANEICVNKKYKKPRNNPHPKYHIKKPVKYSTNDQSNYK